MDILQTTIALCGLTPKPRFEQTTNTLHATPHSDIRSCTSQICHLAHFSEWTSCQSKKRQTNMTRPESMSTNWLTIDWIMRPTTSDLCQPAGTAQWKPFLETFFADSRNQRKPNFVFEGTPIDTLFPSLQPSPQMSSKRFSLDNSIVSIVVVTSWATSDMEAFLCIRRRQAKSKDRTISKQC